MWGGAPVPSPLMGEGQDGGEPAARGVDVACHAERSRGISRVCWRPAHGEPVEPSPSFPRFSAPETGTSHPRAG